MGRDGEKERVDLRALVKASIAHGLWCVCSDRPDLTRPLTSKLAPGQPSEQDPDHSPDPPLTHDYSALHVFIGARTLEILRIGARVYIKSENKNQYHTTVKLCVMYGENSVWYMSLNLQ